MSVYVTGDKECAGCGRTMPARDYDEPDKPEHGPKCMRCDALDECAAGVHVSLLAMFPDSAQYREQDQYFWCKCKLSRKDPPNSDG